MQFSCAEGVSFKVWKATDVRNVACLERLLPKTGGVVCKNK